MHIPAVVHAAEALLWCAGVLLALCGYGAGLLRLGGVRTAPLPLAGAVGIAVAVLIGGLLNLFHSITPAALVGFLVVGVALLMAFRGLGRRAPSAEEVAASPRERAVASVLLALFVAVLAVRLVATVHIDSYQNSDDYAFYLAAPKKMLQVHSYAPDPYSERRIINTVGGCYFLQDLVLVALPIEDLQMADRFLGLMLLAMLGFALGRELRLGRVETAFFALTLVLVPQLMFNLTMVVLPSALFLAMVALAASRLLREEHPALQALLLGGVGGAAASMKSNYVVHAALCLLAFAMVRWRGAGLRAAGKILVFSAVGALVVLGPWMVANRAASGTFFYPLLGHGFHYSAYHIVPSPSTINLHLFATKIVPFAAVLAVLALLQGLATGREEEERAPLALSVAAVAACLVLGLATGGDSLRRYNYPAIVPALLLIFVTVAVRARRAPGERRWRFAVWTAAAFSLLLAPYVGLNSWTREYAAAAHSVRDTLKERQIVPAEVAERYAAVERAVPAGAAAILTTHYNYLFDFRGRTLYLADFAGTAGPPPGWPAFSSGDELGRYLLANGVRYVVFEYGYSDFVPGAYESQEAVDPAVTGIVRNESLLGMNAHRQYRELGQSRRKLYDDGEFFVLDLAAPREGVRYR